MLLKFSHNFAISSHLAGQLVCDPNNDSRSDGFAPADCKGDAEKKREWAVEAMKNSARAAVMAIQYIQTSSR